MRKIHLILFLSVLASACQKHTPAAPDQERPGGRYIFFDAEVAGTKAANCINELPPNANTTFCVFGFRPDNTTPVFDMYSQGTNSAFDNVAVMYRKNPRESFIYDGLALWNSGEHKFYAYYYAHNKRNPFQYDLISDLDTSSDPYITYKQPTAVEDMIDVMTAAETASPSDTPVILTFDHRLFALDVIIRNDQQTTTPLKIMSAKIEFLNIASEADFYFDGRVERRGDISLSYTYDNVVEIGKNPNRWYYPHNDRTNQGNNNTNTFLLIPCPSLKVRITLGIVDDWGLSREIVIDKTADDTAITPEGGFVAGNLYELTIAKKTGEVEFEYEVQDWVIKDVNMEFN